MRISRCFVAAFVSLAACVAFADSAAIAPKCLYSATEANSGVELVPENANVRVTCGVGVGVATFAPSNAQYPCFDLRPLSGTWDLKPWGHIETEVCNTSDTPLAINMRTDGRPASKRRARS